MAQELRAVSALPEDLGWIYTPVPGNLIPSSGPVGTRYAHGAHTYMQAKHTQKMSLKKKPNK